MGFPRKTAVRFQSSRANRFLRRAVAEFPRRTANRFLNRTVNKFLGKVARWYPRKTAVTTHLKPVRFFLKRTAGMCLSKHVVIFFSKIASKWDENFARASLEKNVTAYLFRDS